MSKSGSAKSATGVSSTDSAIQTSGTNVNITGSLNVGDEITVNGQPLTALTTPPGSNTQIPYNDNGSFAASSSFTFQKNAGQVTATSFQATSFVSTHESQFYNSDEGYTDPDPGVARALKLSGGLACDTLSTTGNIKMQGDLYYSAWGDSTFVRYHRGSFSGVTTKQILLHELIDGKPCNFMFSIRSSALNWAHCKGFVYDASKAPALLTQGTSPSLSGATITYVGSGSTAACILVSSCNSSYAYYYHLWLNVSPDA